MSRKNGAIFHSVCPITVTTGTVYLIPCKFPAQNGRASRVTAKGLQSIFRVTARVTPTIHGALPWFVFELVIDYGIFNSQLWGELPQDGYAKGFAAYDPFSLCTFCVSRYSPHHGFLFAILSG